MFSFCAFIAAHFAFWQPVWCEPPIKRIPTPIIRPYPGGDA